jgi:hypothetical protein
MAWIKSNEEGYVIVKVPIQNAQCGAYCNSNL